MSMFAKLSDDSGYIEKKEVTGVIETICQITGLGFMPPEAMVHMLFFKRPWASQLPASYAPALNPRRAAPFDPLVTDHQTGGLDGKMDRQEFSQLVRQLFSMMADQKAAEEGVPAA
ncbi:hypothetical protein MNEG_3923 [Monoraphidium neglectum]|uniref:EF-hand domain-containing protein n=1 Tax=Monoraphidium neglectum TaxID=145388 RepID=A0A0D2LBD2_9CHLO|nr:hypothetical protein MNEG_3923 [Monoraphidium neglectum]KIZ04039.1 hypothetical protein MNEG_3923 [Monoraphidium neglectum]|eukprot:XP_013903058.1 hypothetical protein MNEG_3923 [Monoraphidium neglectum]